MDLLQGETLAERLAGGQRLPLAEVVRVGCQLLDALAATHQRGVIHRDIKPSNIVFDAGEAVLTDFGVSKTLGDPGITLTEPGQLTGTIPYMPPEQLAGSLVTSRTDLYALGMVLFEAATGRLWAVTDTPKELGRVGLPRSLRRALEGALEWYPEDRWKDAESFKRALLGRSVVPGPVAAAAVGLPALLLAVAYRCTLLGMCAGPPWVRIALAPSGTGDRSVADSLSCAVAAELDALIDVRAHCSVQHWIGWRRVAVIQGEVGQRDDSLLVEARGTAQPGRPVEARGLRTAVDDLARRLAHGIYTRILLDTTWLEPPLPPEVLPKTLEGLSLFVQAEQQVKEARWTAAYQFYTAAAAIDSTCWMCYWRRAEFGRWVGSDRDTADIRRYETHAHLFPAHYARQIRAEALPIPQRFDSLEAITRQTRGFLTGHFIRGDELLHRGPLIGRPRREARDAFHDAIRIQARFAPAWEHLAILGIPEGDSAAAAAALDSLGRGGQPTDPTRIGLRALLEIAFAWRFLAEPAARHVMEGAVEQARQAGAPVDAGPRFLIHYDVPRGALALARRLVADPNAEQSALLASVYAHLMLGQPDSARDVAARLRTRFPALGLYVEELDASLAIVGAGAAASGLPWPEIARALSDYLVQHGGSAEAQRRAAWLLALKAALDGDLAGERRYGAFLQDEPAPRPLGLLLRAARLAAARRFVDATALSDTLTTFLARDVPDPFFRATLHLLRAEWYERSDRPEAGWRELVWHENEDRYGGYPRDEPQPVEIDAAFGVEARWRAGRLLDRHPKSGNRDERCRAYAGVARLWASGDSLHRARADTARARLADLGCREGA
jgi:hypothetical protein